MPSNQNLRESAHQESLIAYYIHTYINIIYIYVCVCVCVNIYTHIHERAEQLLEERTVIAMLAKNDSNNAIVSCR